MKLYKLKIVPRSSQITPWQSDTVMGSLCWIIRQKQGEEKLKDFIRLNQEGQYPFVVSGCFPGEYLPKPMAGNVFPFDEDIPKKQVLEIADQAKKAKGENYLNLDEFNQVIMGGRTEIASKGNYQLDVGVMHNTISRYTNTTTEGSLFELFETFWSVPYLTMYAYISDGQEDYFLDLMEQLAQKGYGKRASIGKGVFSVEGFNEFDGFAEPGGANCFVSLSNYVPASSDPVKGQYKTFVKYGKLGQDLGLSENPFKKPLLMIKPGAVFWTPSPRKVYGRLVEKVSGQHDEVVQFGLTLAVPAYIDNPFSNSQEISA